VRSDRSGSRSPVDADRLRGVLDNHGLSYRVGGASYIFTCPLCGKPDKLWMYRDTGGFKCWVCAESRGFKGSPEYAIHEMTGVALARLREEIYGHSLPAGQRSLPIDYGEGDEGDYEPDVDPASLPDPPKPVLWPEDLFLALTDPAASDGAGYVESRGVSTDVAAQYGITYYPTRRSIVFPVRFRGVYYGWQYRTIDPEWIDLGDGNIATRIKAINESIPRDKTVMFADRLDGSKHAVVCEGPFDGLKAHLCGGNVGTMGKAIADGQVAALIRSGVKTVYSALDPDALPEVDRLVRRLGDDVEFRHFTPPRPYKDLGAMRMTDVPDLIFSSPIWRPGRHLPIWYPEGRQG
jgi:hypothetical protein